VDDEPDRRARRPALEHAGQDLDGVRLAPLGRVAGLSGLAAVEVVLDVRLRKGHAWRAAVDDAPDGGPWLSPNEVTVKSLP